MKAVLNGKLLDSVQWRKGSDRTFNIDCLTEGGATMDLTGKTVEVLLYTGALKTGTPVTKTATIVDALSGRITFDMLDTEGDPIASASVGVTMGIDVIVTTTAGGAKERSSNEISMEMI